MKLLKYILILFFIVNISSCLYSQQPTTAVDFTVKDLDGNVHNLFTYLDAGKYVYLDFFLVTCSGCIAAVPDLNRIYNSFGCNDFDLILLSVVGGTSDNRACTAFKNEHRVTYPLVSAVEGNSGPVVNYYGVEAFPAFLIIKPDRTVIWGTETVDLKDIQTIINIGPRRNACYPDWPIPDFTANPQTLPVDSSTRFTSTSRNQISQWLWEFENGTPATFRGQNPPLIKYTSTGYHDVKLRAINEFGNERTITKENYILVYQKADEPPVADFMAEQIVVVVGNTINFFDLSHDYPYEWQWTFQSGLPATANIQNPANIRYNSIGTFDVKLIVRNSEGYDTLLLEDYIKVIPNVGNQIPVANFTANKRLVKVNTPVYFQDLSLNNPSFWSWNFEGGEPATISTQQQPSGIRYSRTGFYDVTLNAGNANGADVLTKQDYIVVYDSFVASVCDTITNMKAGEVPYKMGINGLTGYLAGHNSDRISMYADYYDFHTYNQIYGLIVPILELSVGSPNSYIRFITWDGVDDKPTRILSEQKVYLRDLRQNYYHYIQFNEPLVVDGPFYLGYSINYASGDNIVIGLAPNRGHGKFNSLWVFKDNVWQTAPAAYEVSTSTAIKPISCLVGIENNQINNSIEIYPNPCNTKVYVSNELLFNNGDFVEIYDNYGKSLAIVFAQENNDKVQINTENIAQGSYFMRIFTKGMIINKKLQIIR